MDEINNTPERPTNPRRRKRSQFEIFKESYLPVIIAGAAIVLSMIFIIGSVSRSVSKKQDSKEASIDAENLEHEKDSQLNEEAAQLMTRAENLAAKMQYDEAIAVLDSFSGDLSDPDFSDMAAMRERLVLERSQLVAWDDPSQIKNLAIQMLLADTDRAYNDASFSKNFKEKFLSIDEFQKILSQLYSNGYVLISFDDIIGQETLESGEVVYTTKTLYLPQDKKPLLLTQFNVNYHQYLIDPDNDGTPDKNGSGFASKLIIDENGEVACEYVDANGNNLVGAYDMIPILNAFLEEHPDFSYNGARATIALTANEGLFGYRFDSGLEAQIGTAAYEAPLKELIAKLRSQGYDFACYTYEDRLAGYANLTAAEIQLEMDNWNTQVPRFLGDLDIFVFAREGDIAAPNTAYSGEKFEILENAGFGIFIGSCPDGNSWFMNEGSYVRMGQILLTPANLANNSAWFTNMINADLVLDPARGL